MTGWNHARRARDARLAAAAHLATGKRVDARDAVALLETVLKNHEVGS